VRMMKKLRQSICLLDYGNEFSFEVVLKNLFEKVQSPFLTQMI